MALPMSVLSATLHADPALGMADPRVSFHGTRFTDRRSAIDTLDRYLRRVSDMPGRATEHVRTRGDSANARRQREFHDSQKL